MTRVNLVVYVLLLALLALTCVAAQHDLGRMNTIVSLAIASTKAALVAAFFMRLRERAGLLLIAALAGPLWLGLLVTMVVVDLASRVWLLSP